MLKPSDKAQLGFLSFSSKNTVILPILCKSNFIIYLTGQNLINGIQNGKNVSPLLQIYRFLLLTPSSEDNIIQTIPTIVGFIRLKSYLARRSAPVYQVYLPTEIISQYYGIHIGCLICRSKLSILFCFLICAQYHMILVL